MNQGSNPWAFITSVLLHLALVGVLWWAALNTNAPVIQPAQPPLAIELWSGGAAPLSETVPARSAPAVPVVAAPPAEVNLGGQERVKAKPKKEEPTPKPVPAPPKPQIKEPPKPEPKVKEPPKPKPVEQAKKKALDHPTQKAKPRSSSDDLLADLGPPAAKSGKDKITQAGAAHGVEGGSSKGSGSVSGYDSKVRAKIKPLVRIPDDISGNPTAVVRVTLLPSLEVNRVVLVKSSGNSAYDNAVLSAVKEAGSFPSLPSGLTFDEVRNMTLRFRPQD